MAGEAGEGVLTLGTPTAVSVTPEIHASLLAGEVAAAASYRRRAKAANTVRAYASDCRQFEAWCDERGLDPLPARPEAVATYLAVLAQAGRADSTIGRHLAAIGWHHRQCGHVPPTARDERMVIADTLAGIRREARARPSNKKAAITAADLGAMIAAVRGIGSRAVRDRAILALGLASALRRSELVALRLSDVQLVKQGARITIRHSKTDQEGEGQVIAIPNGQTILPVARLKAWLAVRGEVLGPLFARLCARGELTASPMSDRAIARLVQKYAGLAGLDASAVGAHSLRAGFFDRGGAVGGEFTQNEGGVAAEETRDVVGIYSFGRTVRGSCGGRISVIRIASSMCSMHHLLPAKHDSLL